MGPNDTMFADLKCGSTSMNLDNITVVLVGTTHPGNIGAAARAMKTMGLTRLSLVAPKTFPSAEATALASGADDVLHAALVVDTLPEALAGHTVAYATTARPRRLEWPLANPREAASQIASLTDVGRVAVVFGREQSGLSNDELECCQRAVRIPTSSEYASLNLAQAVQVISYELSFLAHAETATEVRSDTFSAKLERPATTDELSHLSGHLEAVMVAVGYMDPAHPKLMRRRLARFLSRAALTHSEVQIMRGFMTRIEERIEAGSGRGSR